MRRAFWGRARPLRATDIPADPAACLRRYINLWPDSPKDELEAASGALDTLLAERDSEVEWQPRSAALDEQRLTKIAKHRAAFKLRFQSAADDVQRLRGDVYKIAAEDAPMLSYAVGQLLAEVKRLRLLLDGWMENRNQIAAEHPDLIERLTEAEAELVMRVTGYQDSVVERGEG